MRNALIEHSWSKQKGRLEKYLQTEKHVICVNCIMNSLTKVVCTTRNYHICILFCLEERTKCCRQGWQSFYNINYQKICYRDKIEPTEAKNLKVSYWETELLKCWFHKGDVLVEHLFQLSATFTDVS